MARKALVVAPNTVLENWADEVKKFSTLKAIVLQGTLHKRIRLLKEVATIYIINYEALRIMLDELRNAHFEMMICDESQKIKGYKTQQSKCAFKLGQKIPYKLIMTGTPVTNNPLDIFGQYRFLNPFTFGFSFYKFRAKYAIMGGYGNYEVKQWINIEEMKEKIYRCAIRVRKADCLDLPKKLYQTHHVDLTTEQRKLYMALKRDFIAEIEGKTVTAPYVLTRLIRFSQVTAGFTKTEDKEEINFKNNPKLIWLREFIEGLPKGEKVVVFARFKKEIYNIQEMFAERKPFVQTRHVTGIWGDVPQSERQARIKKFNEDPECYMFIGQVETAGLGINLHSARYCVFLSNSYSHGSRLQCEERLHRIGQSRNVTYIDVLARNTIDATILECLKGKKELAFRVIESMRSNKEQSEEIKQ